MYPPPGVISSTSVTPPEPAPLGDGEALVEDEIDVEIEDEGDVEIELEGEEEILVDGDALAEGEEEIDVEGDADVDGDEEMLVEGDSDGEGDVEILVLGDAELEGDVEDDAEDDGEEDGEEEIDVEGERKSICVTRTTARLKEFPFSPATRVSKSPIEYPVPAAATAIASGQSITPSKTSKTEVAAAPASCTPLIKVFASLRSRLVVAETGSDFAIVFVK